MRADLIPVDRDLKDKVRRRLSIGGLDACWEWTGARNSHGYGVVWWRDRSHLTHRAFYTQCRGPIPEGATLDHLCRITSCANPRHLEPVSHRENCIRGTGPAGKIHRTHCSNGHEFTEANTYHSVSGGRVCRICKRYEQKARRRMEGSDAN